MEDPFHVPADDSKLMVLETSSSIDRVAALRHALNGSEVRSRGYGSVTSMISFSCPGRAVMMTTRSPSKIASSTLCVMNRIVFRVARHALRSSSWSTPRV